ncbi:unnamed protein product [Adineta steineri]|uniref:NHL repeat containing protein n=1 Tax=Adineta steineri TaxID=433720 RepID=A0A814BTC9_9BILA|nr:unnamed protein product [Adineta steineri]CAF1543087.1 unnamed protein product [Adineta steineri]
MKTNSISIVKVTRQRIKQTKNNQHWKIKKTSRKVVHVTAGLSHQNTSRSVLNSTIDNLQNDKSFQSIVNNNNSIALNQHQDDKPVSLNLSKVKDAWANPMDYHNKRSNQNLNNKKKKTYTRSCLIWLLLVLVLLIIIGLIVLIVFLTKPKTSTTTNIANPVLRWNASGITVAGVTGMSGINASQLNNPWGLALTYDGTLYVTDCYNNRVQQFVSGSTVGTTVAGDSNGMFSNMLNSLFLPSKIVLDSNENLYIADGFNNRGLYWTKGSNSGVLIAGTGAPGSALDQLNYTYDIARNWNSDITYVADYQNNRVMGYRPGNITGFVVAGNNGAGGNYTQLNGPIAIYFDSLTNSILIANFNRHNIVRWTLGANNWTLVVGSINGLPGSTSTLLFAPTGLTLDPMGNLYVADLANHRIQLFLNGEMNATTIAGKTGQLGNDSMSLNQPYTIALDNQLNLYVADNQNHRIQKFLRY